eukprot:TRINITY_DN5007_c0_g1_i1.p1 TRINITY_DN5007_c0_g1~~TRINITY_DN5007_c0_g1_i1.p1  ORF type:complete len:521 (+),score=181.83 TRINITY_DN5007_c0_g1_i1:37-1599(+)
MSQSQAFSKYLAGPQGLEIITKRVEDSMKSTQEILEYIKRVTEIEQTYANSILKLNQITNKRLSSIRGESGALKEIWDHLRERIGESANHHGVFANSVHGCVFQSLTKSSTELEYEQRQIVEKGAMMTKEYKESVAAMKKLQGVMAQKVKEADQPTSKFDIIKDSTSKIHKKQQAALNAEKDYQASAKAANTRLTKFFQLQLPSLLNDFQNVDEKRISNLQDYIKKIVIFKKQIPSNDSVFSPILNMLKSASIETDIAQFALENKTDWISSDAEGNPISGPDTPRSNGAEGSVPPNMTRFVLTPSINGPVDGSNLAPVVNTTKEDLPVFGITASSVSMSAIPLGKAERNSTSPISSRGRAATFINKELSASSRMQSKVSKEKLAGSKMKYAPLPREVTLNHLLNDKYGRKYFSRYLAEKELSDENLIFYDLVNEFKATADIGERHKKMHHIFSTYVKEFSEFQVNLDDSTVRTIADKIEDGCLNTDIFDEAQAFILDMMCMHSLPRFKMSAYWDKYVNGE